MQGAQALVKDLCGDLQYRAVAVNDGNSTIVYFIGSARQPNAIVFGRHYRVSGADVVSSTKSCLTVPVGMGKGKLAASMITHLLSHTPTEFHVFESFLHNTLIYVKTDIGVWSVQEGEIHFVARNTSQAPPKDRPVDVTRDQVSQQDAEIGPLIAKARNTYPDARRRFLEGLPQGEHFAVVTRLSDKTGRFEQVFLAVESIDNDHIRGRIISEVELISDYRRGDTYSLAEGDILDWVISKSDGSEEGNLIGKYLDSRH